MLRLVQIKTGDKLKQMLKSADAASLTRLQALNPHVDLAKVRAGNVATLRVDDRRTLVFAGNRAFVGVAAADADAVGAVQVRGGIAQVQANALSARGRMPAVVVSANGEAMISDNRVELIAGDGTTAVVLSTPVLVLSANRVRHAGPAVSISASKSVAALGNITSGNITVGGGPLPAPFADLNLIG